MADSAHGANGGVKPDCGDIVLFEGERWHVVAVNNGRAIFVRRGPEGELRRCRPFCEFTIIERGLDPLAGG